MNLLSLSPAALRTPFAEVAINGVACRLPGAANEAAFWALLAEGRCAVGGLPAGRWRPERFLHPEKNQPGFSYTFAGGYIDDPLGFDPAVFGISPREATEIDPQQRLLLEVVWGALEDAGIPPSALAGSEVGVYVGASSLDYGSLHTTDPAAIDSHFMTGNTLSVLANRISYIYDLRGPSFTVDTACSSSLVAFAEAQAAIASGRIDMAIVAGVNLLLSPIPFIGFSRASMLSPTGLCRPFAALADGYVRAEGAVAMLLSRRDTAIRRGYPVRAVALASGVNSDGRTSGISLPAMEGQRALLERLYGEAGIDPRKLAFVEAHGTGTRVGDPAEATAIGEALGQKRADLLPIGSVKSNIGHLEPASGLAGMFKAILAMEHYLLPRSLHLDEINPSIDFGALNLQVATAPVALANTGTLHAGISSFGFGGTNAHVVIRAAEGAELVADLSEADFSEATLPENGQPNAGRAPQILLLSAQSRAALGETAFAFARFIETSGNAPARIAAAAAWQRDAAAHRLALPLDEAAGMASALRGFAETGSLLDGAVGAAPSSPPKLCFVFSGNGCQWPGMSRVAYAHSAAFRRRFDEIDTLFGGRSGWSLAEALHEPDIGAKLKLTGIAQPLLFATQSALNFALGEAGLRPDMALGHSVGEVAAAEASGAISLADAVHIIFHRSQQQEAAHGLGGMAVASLSHDEASALIAEAGLAGIEIAASNSPSSVTLSGDHAAIQRFSRLAQKRRIAVKPLDLAYPFHSSLLTPIRAPLLAALGNIAGQRGGIDFISTVTGSALPGDRLDAEYWWRNVREPVRFRDAIEVAAKQGAGLFIEIGPRPILTASIADTLRGIGMEGAVLPSLTEEKTKTLAGGAMEGFSGGDPLQLIVAKALASGCEIDLEQGFGARPSARMKLPGYAWQRKSFAHYRTSEALDFYGTSHPLLGARLLPGGAEWRNLLSAETLPYLADHRVDGEIVVPGAAFAEMALAVARQVFPTGPIGLEDFDLLQWLPLQPGMMREISVRLAGEARLVEIWSRPRFKEKPEENRTDEWSLHARGRIVRLASKPPAFVPRQDLPHAMTAERIYAMAQDAGVEYGPEFRKVIAARRDAVTIEIDLAPIETAMNVLHPVALDAAFHALFESIKPREAERYAYLPVRFAALRVDQDGGVPIRARVTVERETDQSLSISAMLYTEDDTAIATLAGGLFRAVVFERHKPVNLFFRQGQARLRRFESRQDWAERAATALREAMPAERPESWLILEAFARSLAFKVVSQVTDYQANDRDAPPLGDGLLSGLEAAGLATRSAEGWALAASSGLPEPAQILEAFAAEFAGATPEIVLAAQALAGLAQATRGGAAIIARPAILEQFERQSILFAPLLAAARDLAESLAAQVSPDPLRILLAAPCCLGLLHVLLPLARAGQVAITIAGADAKRLRQLEARHGKSGLEFLEITDEPDEGAAGFDLGFAFALNFASPFASSFWEDARLARGMAAKLAPGGLLGVLQPSNTIIFDALFGGIGQPVEQPTDAKRALAVAGFGLANVIDAATGTILLAMSEARLAQPDMPSRPVTLIGDDTPILHHLAQALRTDGRRAGRRASGDVAAIISDIGAEPADLVFTAFGGRSLTRTLGDLAALLDAIAAGADQLWILVKNLDHDPDAEAVWCFARVAMNEYPGIGIRLVDIAADLDDETAARHIHALISASPAGASPTEAELLVSAAGVSAIRVAAGLWTANAARPAAAARLALPAKGVLAQFDWLEAVRRPPGPDEIEVEIAASGLNFRDVMLATGLLDDDVLDDGLAGAVFGFECAGVVRRVGTKIAHLQPGDAVMGFGRQSFATHATADARVFSKVPQGITVEAAATIPVAFLTAWYALAHLARLQKGEWVLIHGAAGGVGIAAMQIARQRGARIAATVSSPDKRAVAAMFGAERIYNSRSTEFQDAIRDEIGGVDVVLNSLAGDAMLASLKCLKPFGRFIELGKRDYVANTSLGLRPFRRNLTYFGVDLDQLLAANPALTKTMMDEVVGHFERGDFCPLPYRAFDWHNASEAFQAMQSALHVGKLVVRPPTPPMVTVMPPKQFAPGPGAHLVIGGTGGFGFETALWLAEQGAKTVIVASRRGRFAPELEARAEAARATGAQIIAETLDVTDPAAVDGLLETLRRAHGRIAGIIHAAMVLDDGLIANLTPARIAAVLAPKVTGAKNLDRATRPRKLEEKLDYFVAYSSATAMIGNPGQASYVAANGYLQGLMRRRRAEGLPGLAVAWGAIADAGALTRDADVAAKLERISGISAMPAHEALGYLGGLLAEGDAIPATVTCAAIRPNAMLRELPLLQTPAFGTLFAAAESGHQETGFDLAAMIAGKSEAEARILVANMVAAEVARILRLAAEDIDPVRPLDELGMDSLMSIELRMGIETRFGVELPVVAISSGVNVNDLAARLIAGASGKREDNKPEAGLSDAEQLLLRHGARDVGLAELIAVTGAIEEKRTVVESLL